MMRLQSQSEANAYWSTREHKKWTVTLTGPKRTISVRGRDGEWTHESGIVTMYVTAGTAEGAIACAIQNCYAPQRWISKTARLATAQDLGCVHVAVPLIDEFQDHLEQVCA